MNLSIECNLDLVDSPASAWREWIRKLDDTQLPEVRSRIVQYSLKADNIILPMLRRVLGMLDDEMVARFPVIVTKLADMSAGLDRLQRLTAETEAEKKALSGELVRVASAVRPSLPGVH